MDTLTRVNKVLAQTDGRDKLYKVLQYGSRLLHWYYTSVRKVAPDAVAPLLRMDQAMVSSRKVFRLLKFLGEAQKLLSSQVLKNASTYGADQIHTSHEQHLCL